MYNLFINSIHFGLRRCDEQRHMKRGDVQLLKDANVTECLEYSEKVVKMRTGTEPRNVRTVIPKAFSVANAPTERIPVFV